MEIHYFAAARAARGISTETVPATDATLADFLAQLIAAQDDFPAGQLAFKDVCERSSFLVDGVSAEGTTSLAGVTRLDILPPFAGG